MKLTNEQIAETAHEANRAYCHSIGDYSQLPWRLMSQEHKDLVSNGVEYHLKNPDSSPRLSHENWMAKKKEQGWKYGPEKNEHDKTHPCIRPYNELSAEQRAKDFIFSAVVATLRNF